MSSSDSIERRKTQQQQQQQQPRDANKQTGKHCSLGINDILTIALAVNHSTQ